MTLPLSSFYFYYTSRIHQLLSKYYSNSKHKHKRVSVNTTSAPSAEILHRPSGGVSVLFAATVAARRRSHYNRRRRISVADLGFFRGGLTLGTLLSLTFPSLPSLFSPSSPIPAPSLQSHPFLSPPIPSPLLTLEVGPIIESSSGARGSTVSSPSGVWSAAPAEIKFGAF